MFCPIVYFYQILLKLQQQPCSTELILLDHISDIFSQYDSPSGVFLKLNAQVIKFEFVITLRFILLQPRATLLKQAILSI